MAGSASFPLLPRGLVNARPRSDRADATPAVRVTTTTGTPSRVTLSCSATSSPNNPSVEGSTRTCRRSRGSGTWRRCRRQWCSRRSSAGEHTTVHTADTGHQARSGWWYNARSHCTAFCTTSLHNFVPPPAHGTKHAESVPLYCTLCRFASQLRHRMALHPRMDGTTLLPQHSADPYGTSSHHDTPYRAVAAPRERGDVPPLSLSLPFLPLDLERLRGSLPGRYGSCVGSSSACSTMDVYTRDSAVSADVSTSRTLICEQRKPAPGRTVSSPGRGRGHAATLGITSRQPIPSGVPRCRRAAAEPRTRPRA